ncbi:restriction endonuclease subunit S [Leptospira levettii]|uniref:restriction endonuclease subunit S n=1 Tax=Leptospira levettii TaxID=2023178 RepID=UPI003EB93AC9
MKPYPKYKDSGVEWLGEIPVGWEVIKLSRSYSVQLGKMLQPNQTTKTDVLKPYLRSANITWDGVDTSEIKLMYFSTEEIKKYKLFENDLLVSEGGDVGRSCLWKGELEECYIQNAINRVRGKKSNNTKFLFYYIFKIKHIGWIDILCNKSTIAHFTAEKLNAITIPLPPLAEQKAIATFLDRETAKIDTLIAKQEQLIALLEEKRQALISHAVTKGLDPNTKMKDSGVEWLGEIPEGWEVNRLKFICKVYGRIGFRGYTTEDIVDEGLGAITLSPSNMAEGELKFDKVTYISWKKYHESPEIQVKPGDILVVKTGSTYGKIAMVRELNSEATINPQIAIFKEAKVHELFLFNFLVSPMINEQFKLMNSGSTIPTMTQENLVNLPIPHPSLTEQKAIAEFLDKQTKKLDLIKEKALSVIELLKEKRSALISSAVTGKIDVRELV